MKLPSHLQCVPNAVHTRLYCVARPRYLPSVAGLRTLISTLCARLRLSPPPPPRLPNLLETLLPLHGISKGTDAAAFAKSVGGFLHKCKLRAEKSRHGERRKQRLDPAVAMKEALVTEQAGARRAEAGANEATAGVAAVNAAIVAENDDPRAGDASLESIRPVQRNHWIGRHRKAWSEAAACIVVAAKMNYNMGLALETGGPLQVVMASGVELRMKNTRETGVGGVVNGADGELLARAAAGAEAYSAAGAEHLGSIKPRGTITGNGGRGSGGRGIGISGGSGSSGSAVGCSPTVYSHLPWRVVESHLIGAVFGVNVFVGEDIGSRFASDGEVARNPKAKTAIGLADRLATDISSNFASGLAVSVKGRAGGSPTRGRLPPIPGVWQVLLLDDNQLRRFREWAGLSVRGLRTKHDRIEMQDEATSFARIAQEIEAKAAEAKAKAAKAKAAKAKAAKAAEAGAKSKRAKAKEPGRRQKSQGGEGGSKTSRRASINGGSNADGGMPPPPPRPPLRGSRKKVDASRPVAAHTARETASPRTGVVSTEAKPSSDAPTGEVVSRDAARVDIESASEVALEVALGTASAEGVAEGKRKRMEAKREKEAAEACKAEEQSQDTGGQQRLVCDGPEAFKQTLSSQGAVEGKLAVPIAVSGSLNQPLASQSLRASRKSMTSQGLRAQPSARAVSRRDSAGGLGHFAGGFGSAGVKRRASAAFLSSFPAAAAAASPSQEKEAARIAAEKAAEKTRREAAATAALALERAAAAKMAMETPTATPTATGRSKVALALIPLPAPVHHYFISAENAAGDSSRPRVLGRHLRPFDGLARYMMLLRGSGAIIKNPRSWFIHAAVHKMELALFDRTVIGAQTRRPTVRVGRFMLHTPPLLHPSFTPAVSNCFCPSFPLQRSYFRQSLPRQSSRGRLLRFRGQLLALWGRPANRRAHLRGMRGSLWRMRM